MEYVKVFQASTKEEAMDEATVWVLKQGKAIAMTAPADSKYKPKKGWAVTVHYRYRDRSK